jgi:hypothetical protein
VRVFVDEAGVIMAELWGGPRCGERRALPEVTPEIRFVRPPLSIFAAFQGEGEAAATLVDLREVRYVAAGKRIDEYGQRWILYEFRGAC